MPDELSPGYVACSSCSRVIATRHANSSGRCATCAGKTEDQIEEAQAEPVGHVMAAEGGVLVEPDDAETTTTKPKK